jgi:aldehyde dehydrogenase (NAD+)
MAGLSNACRFAQRNAAPKKAGFPDLFFLFNDAGTELASTFVDDHRIALLPA